MTTIAREPRRDDMLGAPRDSVAIACRAQLACVLEASAPKPGNVSPGRPFADVRYEDFVVSAEAIARPLEGAGRRPLGETIFMAVEATAVRTSANTNLGIVLLLAPLARAAVRLLDVAAPAERSDRLRNLRTEVGHVLRDTTVGDASQAYRAIRLVRSVARSWLPHACHPAPPRCARQ